MLDYTIAKEGSATFFLVKVEILAKDLEVDKNRRTAYNTALIQELRSFMQRMGESGKHRPHAVPVRECLQHFDVVPDKQT